MPTGVASGSRSVARHGLRRRLKFNQTEVMAEPDPAIYP